MKPKHSNMPCFVDEGANRLLIRGALQEDAQQPRLALFRLDNDEILEYRVIVKADWVSPFDLAASWRAYKENFRPSAVRGIPDVSINSVPPSGSEVKLNNLGTLLEVTTFLLLKNVILWQKFPFCPTSFLLHVIELWFIENRLPLL